LEPGVIEAWMDEVGGFSVGENFDGNPDVLVEWLDATGVSALEFAAFYKMEKAIEGMFGKVYPDKAVTFVANHDPEKEENEHNRIATENKGLCLYFNTRRISNNFLLRLRK
jgi:alpha-amylase